MNVFKMLKEGTKKLSDLFEDKEESNGKVKEEKPQEVKVEVRKEVEIEQEKPKTEIKKEETKPEIKEEIEKKIEEPKPAVKEEPKKEAMQKAKTQQQEKPQDKTMKITQTGMPTKEDVMKVLEGVNDPEIGIDVVTLELIYNVNLENDVANIKMTFTTPMCPYGPQLVEEIKSKVKELNGIKDVNVDVVFDPPWQPSKELRATLGA